MTPDLVAFRISRRAIGVAALSDEDVAFADGRHLTSRRDRAVPAAVRYVQALVERFQPTIVGIHAPSNAGDTTRSIVEFLTGFLGNLGITVHVLDTPALLSAFGGRPLKSARQLQQAVLDIWPTYEGLGRSTKAVIADAVATALVTELRAALDRPT